MPAMSRTAQTRLKTSTASKSSILSASKSSQTPLATLKNSTFNVQTSTGKRKRNDDQEQTQSSAQSDSKKLRQPSKKASDSKEEKRLKAFRGHPPKSFLQKLHRAQTQRMIVVDRQRHGSGLDLHEDISIIGSTGNIYKVTISRLPQCTCPDHLKGHECKHKVYALHTVLKAPENLQYQLAFLTAELDEIFSHAPPIPSDRVGDADGGGSGDGKRKPVEGECPICYMDFEEDKNQLVWCKAACGNNMHKSCFEQWAASQKGQAVRCVYCRTEWEMDKNDLKKIENDGVVGEDGYVNVAEQFGISRARDYSTYYQPWARRQFGYGW